MKFFTPALFIRSQNLDPVEMDRTEEEWETANQHYEAHLGQLGLAIAPLCQKFDGLLLHDAQVLAITRRDSQFSIVLLEDIPPRQVVTLTYTLSGEPAIDRNALPAPYRSGVMQFLHDEFDLSQEGQQTLYVHDMLFGNGWEICLVFRDVQIALAESIYPPVAPAVSVSQSA